MESYLPQANMKAPAVPCKTDARVLGSFRGSCGGGSGRRAHPYRLNHQLAESTLSMGPLRNTYDFLVVTAGVFNTRKLRHAACCFV